MPKFNFTAVNKLFDTIAADATQHAFALMGSGVDGAGRNKAPIERMIKRLQDLEVAAANGLPYKDPIDTGKEETVKDTDAMNRARLLRIASAAARMNVSDAENELKGYAQADLRPRTRRAYGAAREALTTARQACDDLNKEAQADEFAATQMAGKEVEGSPGEHKEASEKAGDITQEDEEGAKRAVGQANRLLSDASTPMVAAAEALSGNWLAKMRAARGLQHIRDAMQSVARARSALQDYSYGNKEAPERPTLPSGRYADVSPWRLTGEE